MDTETVRRVTETVEEAAEKADVSLDRVVVFGSRARDDYREESDVDVLLVSEDFEGVRNYRRSKLFFRYWDYENLPDPEFVCLTPEEFESGREAEAHIVRTAVEEGVAVA